MGTLRDTLYQTIHRNRKPLKLIAEEIGMSENYLTRAALPDHDEQESGSGCRFPLKKLIPLIRSTADYRILDHIEASLGRVAIVLPKAHHQEDQIVRLTMQSVKEFGELMSTLDESLSDGNLSKMEIANIVREGQHAIQAIVSLLGHVDPDTLK